MRKIAILVLLLVIVTLGGAYLYFSRSENPQLLNPAGRDETQTAPLSKYNFNILRSRPYQASKITLEKVLDEEAKFTSHLFIFTSDGDKVSGVANIPGSSLQDSDNSDKLPVIVLLRGYIDKDKYQTGDGTKSAGYAFARNGFVTLAPDFLGYGESASPSADVFEERFQKYTTVLNLLASIKTLPQTDPDRVGLWGHSNGGHLALATLELTGKPYPTILWAPVSKPFPYSILYYTDEYDDRGKLLRGKLAEFEKTYNVEDFNFTDYYSWINEETPLQLHQGGADDAVPLAWSDELYEELDSRDLPIEYFTYPDEDHNLARGSWQTVINRNILFYKESLR